jgi:hypothetical protein
MSINRTAIVGVALTALTELTHEAANGDAEATAAMQNDDDPTAEVDLRARDYGFEVCGSSE